jgi:hypothetical protein
LSLSVEHEERVAALWQASCESNPNLFDGRQMMVTDRREGALVLREARYRHYLAGRADPDFGRRLGLRALGVSGLLSCPDGLVFGRRAEVSAHSGLWELVPSGGAENGNLQEQIVKELGEEIGLNADQVSVGEPIGLIESEGVIDVVLPLVVSLGAAEIVEIHARRGSAEYDLLHVTSAPEDFVNACGDAVMSVTRLLVGEVTR